MGNKLNTHKVKLSDGELNEWKKRYHLNDDKLLSFLKEFNKLKGKDNKISRKEFVKMLVDVGVASEMAELMFNGKLILIYLLFYVVFQVQIWMVAIV